MARWKVLLGGLVVVALLATVLTSFGGGRHGSKGPDGHVRLQAGQSKGVHPEVVVGAPSPSGLPIWANYRLIPVWTLNGQPMYVNASVTPVVIFNVSDPLPAESVLRTAAKLPGPHPLMLVAAGFPAESLAKAEAQTLQLAATRFEGQSVVLLQGPVSSYAKALPVFAYVGHTATVADVVPVGGGIKPSVLAAAFNRTLAGVRLPPVRSAQPATPKTTKKGAKA